MDPQFFQREIAEATNMTQEEMNIAAREIIRQSRQMGHGYESDVPLSSPNSDTSTNYRWFPSSQQQNDSSDLIDRHALVNMTSL